ncbi:hypothetical protein [Cryptosporangium sp. NPDC048952]|uniref:hypothetical protein n=1 Tax=Cryptosporangium sp. NPDC048952 TaxID=3363961 RepID=UPI0037104BF5
MIRRRPPLAEPRPISDAAPGHVPSNLVLNDDPALSLRIGGDGVVLGVEPNGAPLGVRLFRPTPTRAVFVGAPNCAQLIAFRAVAAGAHVVVSTGRPGTWTFLASQGIPVRPVDSTPETATRTRPVLYVDDAPPYGRPPELPTNRWTTVLTIREVLTHREAGLIEHADLLLLQPLTPAEADVLPPPRRIDQPLPADALTVASRSGVRWGRVAVTPTEHHYLGPARRAR